MTIALLILSVVVSLLIFGVLTTIGTRLIRGSGGSAFQFFLAAIVNLFLLYRLFQFFEGFPSSGTYYSRPEMAFDHFYLFLLIPLAVSALSAWLELKRHSRVKSAVIYGVLLLLFNGWIAFIYWFILTAE